MHVLSCLYLHINTHKHKFSVLEVMYIKKHLNFNSNVLDCKHTKHNPTLNKVWNT